VKMRVKAKQIEVGERERRWWGEWNGVELDGIRVE